MPEQNCAVVLAGGEGKRMKWDRPKSLSPVLFKPMLQWVLDAVRRALIPEVCVVTGFQHEKLEEYLSQNDPGAVPVFQPERKGTGHAVMMAAGFLRSRAPRGNVLVLNGDAPFLDGATIQNALRCHCKEGNAVTVVSAVLDNPGGYGRIIRGASGGLKAIVEQKDASVREKTVKEVNSGAFWFRTEDLLEALPLIRNENSQGEYYLTDAVQILIGQGRRAGAYPAETPGVVLGANDCLQLHELNTVARKAVLSALMSAGVDIPCTDGVVIGPDVTVGRSCTILPGTILRGKTVIGDGCILGPGTVLEDCTVGGGAVLDSVRGKKCTIEPGRAVRPFTVLG
jgi:bifunctional UDP-N-acetylglucosamine pyrophosphorylase/glucosamine-1-phosphate N-acetyltransferase